MFNIPKRTEISDSEGSGFRPTAAAPSYRPHTATLIARGVKLEGEFTSQGDVQIEGEVTGRVTAAGTLTIGAEAVITADVKADEAVISGVLNGNLTVAKQVVLHSSAKITGDIVAERASVESGAVIEGRVHVGARAEKTEDAEEAAEAPAVIGSEKPSETVAA